MEHTIVCLEEQQDEFDFKYQTHKLEGKQTDKFWLYLHALRMSNTVQWSESQLHVLFCFGLSLMETLIPQRKLLCSCGR